VVDQFQEVAELYGKVCARMIGSNYDQRCGLPAKHVMRFGPTDDKPLFLCEMHWNAVQARIGRG
jgi:hypothetical protein